MIINDPANDVSIDLHIVDEKGTGWLEIRNNEAVIKRFKKQYVNSCRTDAIEDNDTTKIKQILLEWIEKNI